MHDTKHKTPIKWLPSGIVINADDIKKNKQMPDQKLMGLHLDEKLNHIDKNLNWVFSF